MDQNPPSFEPILDAHWGKILGLVVRMAGDAHEGEEIAQETFFRAYQAWPKFEARSSVLTWLFRIAINTCKAHMMKKRRAAISLEEAPPLVVHDRDPIEAREERDRLESAMQAISPKHRMVLTLFCQEELSHEEIAGLLDCPVGTVWSRLYSARSALAQQLQSFTQEAAR